MSSRRASLPPTPLVLSSTQPHRALPSAAPDRRNRLFSRPSQPTLYTAPAHPSVYNSTHRSSQPTLGVHFDVEAKQPRDGPSQPLLYYRDHFNSHSPKMARKLPKASEKRILKRATQSDLAFRFQRQSEPTNDAPTNPPEEAIDPVYLALKQATGKYGRRGSSAHNFGDSASPSPRNLSQVSLQDSGYAETSSSQGQLLGSTPQLDISGSSGRRRAPKLNKQMKSLSLDCAEMPPPVNNALRSPYRNKPTQRTPVRTGYTGSGEMSDWERSCSPNVPSPRRLPSSPAVLPKTTTRPPSHIVIHEYLSGEAGPLYLGDRIHIVDNGDPDWLHGFKDGDRLEQLITFPSTCVAQVHSGEQPMRITQNVHIPDSKLRLYRDQVVFAQADSIRDGRVLVRNEHNAFANCPLQYLTLL